MKQGAVSSSLRAALTGEAEKDAGGDSTWVPPTRCGLVNRCVRVCMCVVCVCCICVRVAWRVVRVAV